MRKFLPYLSALFFLLVIYLLTQTLGKVDWGEVKESLFKLSVPVVLSALGFALLDYFVLATYDYLGFRYFRISFMKYPRVLISAFTSYAFNLNLGALVGGLAFRFKIYSGWGVAKGDISKIVAFSTITNWMGHSFLLTMVFSFYPEEIQKLLGLPLWGSYAFAGILAFLLLGYFLGCVSQKSLRIKEHEIIFPKFPLALLQLLLSSLQWSLVSFIIYYLIQELGYDISYGRVIFTALAASVAGVFTHIPGGLGVLEAVFLKVNLGVPAPQLLVALIGYRVVYYLIPLLLAVPSYLGIEYTQKRAKS